MNACWKPFLRWRSRGTVAARVGLGEGYGSRRATPGLVGGKASRAVVGSPLVWRTSDRSLAVACEPGCRGAAAAETGRLESWHPIRWTPNKRHRNVTWDTGSLRGGCLDDGWLSRHQPHGHPGLGASETTQLAAVQRSENRSRAPCGSDARILGRLHDAKASARKSDVTTGALENQSAAQTRRRGVSLCWLTTQFVWWAYSAIAVWRWPWALTRRAGGAR